MAEKCYYIIGLLNNDPRNEALLFASMSDYHNFIATTKYWDEAKKYDTLKEAEQDLIKLNLRKCCIDSDWHILMDYKGENMGEETDKIDINCIKNKIYKLLESGVSVETNIIAANRVYSIGKIEASVKISKITGLEINTTYTVKINGIDSCKLLTKDECIWLFNELKNLYFLSQTSQILDYLNN